ncbi:uncharacterized protein LOC127704612 [Mytilus californianus]|uniref:uncharacterized protein LOC127704612 n=1 Tax=Mytilus californianus TaxID=6549 RepID=UPI0022456D4B|nr:uncharacterized protein LOC127704612 [Mytilus californianus]
MYRAIEWRKMMISELPPHDHLMIFTGRDLYTKISRDYSVTGFASLDSVCRQDSVSIIEDRGGFDCIITATHELGHSLGARHDGDRNICTPQNKFIMTSIGGGDVTKQTVLNPFRFSECSKSYFLDRLQTLNNQGHNCLSVRKSYYDPREFAGLTSVATGQLFSPNKQCQMKLGDDSFYGWGGNLGSFKDVCTHMACKSNKSSTSYNLYNAARGTSCGNKKWCINGECTYDQKAPAKDDACIHGDSLRSFAAYYSCANMISSDPSKCTDRYYRQFCCESCKQYGLNTFTLPGVNTRRTAPNVMSIPITQHMQRVLPNTFSVRGRQDGFGRPRGSSHHVFSASPVNRNFNSVNQIPRNRGNTNDKFRIFSRHNNMHSGISGQTSNHHTAPQHHQQQYDQNHFLSDSNRYGLKTDSNQFGQRTDSNQFALRTDSNQLGLQTDSNKFGHQSDSNKFGMQTSRTDPSISLPDHQRLSALQSSFSSMNPGDLSSFRNLIMRTLHLLARTDGSQYNQYNQVPSHNHDNSYMQGTHHDHINPSNGFFNMREVPRVVVEEVTIDTNDSISIETNSTSNMTVSSNTTVETEPLSFSKSQLEEELRNFNLNIALPKTEAKSTSKKILNTKSHKDKTLSNSLLDNIIDPFLK